MAGLQPQRTRASVFKIRLLVSHQRTFLADAPVMPSAQSRRLWSAMARDDDSLGLMLVLCFAQSGRFLEPFCELRIGSGPRGRWFESTRPDQFSKNPRKSAEFSLAVHSV